MTNTTSSPPASSTTNTSATTSHEPGSAPPSKEEEAPGDDKPVAPSGDAGVFDVDPDQTDADQNSETAITGDIDSFPLDMEP
jgi:hypothetical protein